MGLTPPSHRARPTQYCTSTCGINHTPATHGTTAPKVKSNSNLLLHFHRQQGCSFKPNGSAAALALLLATVWQAWRGHSCALLWQLGCCCAYVRRREPLCLCLWARATGVFFRASPHCAGIPFEHLRITRVLLFRHYRIFRLLLFGHHCIAQVFPLFFFVFWDITRNARMLLCGTNPNAN